MEMSEGSGGRRGGLSAPRAPFPLPWALGNKMHDRFVQGPLQIRWKMTRRFAMSFVGFSTSFRERNRGYGGKLEELVATFVIHNFITSLTPRGPCKAVQPLPPEPLVPRRPRVPAAGS
jgi:hypothetical protein